MKGIDKLTHITKEQREKLIHSANQYKRFARIYIEIIEVDKKVVGAVKGWKDERILLKVKVYQLENPTEKYLSAKELKERAFEVFSVLSAPAISIDDPTVGSHEIEITAVPFKFLNVITIEYIREKQAELGLSDIDLSRLLGVRRENLSRIFNDKRGLTKLGKAAFYYLFKYLEK